LAATDSNIQHRWDFGVTGTRYGMTAAQRKEVLRIMVELAEKRPNVHLHHGCCIGADEQYSLLGAYLGFYLVAHIPERREYMSMPAYELSNFINPARPYLERNRIIVDRSSYLIAAPKDLNFNSSRGTWYTIEYAQSKGIPITIVAPDGRVQNHGSL